MNLSCESALWLFFRWTFEGGRTLQVAIDTPAKHSYVSHMNVVKIADLKNNLSRHLARVRKGGQITVFDRETPIARIVPFSEAAHAARGAAHPDPTGAADRIADLARQGIVSPGDPRALAGWLNDHQPIPRPPGAPSAVDLLLQMRRESTR